jgi:GNAT superfamily N-acetyltransferase
VALAEVDGDAVGTAYTVRSDGAAGPAVFLAGVAVLEPFRRRGIAGAMSAWLLERAFAAGARLAHLHPDTDAAARVYSRLGFSPAGALEIYVDL